MNRKIIRWSLLGILFVSVLIGPVEPLQYFNPFAIKPPKAAAQEQLRAPALEEQIPQPAAPDPITPSRETSTPVPEGYIPVSTPTPVGGAPTPCAIPTPQPAAASPFASLPSLTDEPAKPGDEAEGDVGKPGGRVSSPDGRVTIDFPAGAISEPLKVKITSLDSNSLLPLPGQTLVSGWKFEAFAPGRSMAKVDKFLSDVTVEMRLSDDDLIGLDPHSLRLWTMNSDSGEWEAISTMYDARNQGYARLS
jgi:hypothetical protein